ncbi:MAG: PAS domain S-box protein [Ignavibacteriae bacterium]|nr:PAS domain S-box protein [Ignavibacteriota bacterium]
MQTTITEFWWIFSIATAVFLTLAIGFITITIYSQKRFIASQEEKFKILQESEERFRQMVEQSPVPTAVLINNVFTYVNDAVINVLNAPMLNDVLGKSLIDITEVESRNHAVSLLEQFTNRQVPLAVTELKIQRLDGILIDTEISTIPITYSGTPAALLILSDVTKPKQAAALLREIPRKIIDAQESERRRFSRELHDGVNQILFNVKGQIETLERKAIPVLNNGIKNLSHILDPLKDAMKEIQWISRNLRPSALDDFGLGAAVRSMSEDFSSRTRIRTQPMGFPQYRLAPELELALFRIVQESLNNIEKHSMATNVLIECRETESFLTVIISDNGVGVDMERLSTHLNSAGVGLATMKERTELIGGTFSIGSTLGKGTQIVVQTPKLLPAVKEEETT